MADAPLAPNPGAAPDDEGWRRLLSVSTAHLTGATLQASSGWVASNAEVVGSAPAPMFGQHPFGFYCAPIPVGECEQYWQHCPDDLRAVLEWADGHGAELVSFDADGTLHDALPDYSDTHGRALETAQ